MILPIARILDANFNRAREALRVMEDYARFVLNDSAGSRSVKELRHELAALAQRLPADALLSARDTGGDVGVQITTEAETHRESARDVCVAAGKRLSEALRVLEEYGKTINPPFAAAIEALRYRGYLAEQRILLRGGRAGRFAELRLYVLITASLCRADWLATAEAAIAGGAGCLQLREKDLEDGDLLARARQLSELCHRHQCLCIINDRPDIALLSDADGVHLGQTDLPIAEARRIVGPDCLVGISTHNLDQLQAAIAGQPDYIAVGPMFASTTKPQDHIPGSDLLRSAISLSPVPVVAIGGITPERAAILRHAGAGCLCACSAVISAPDVTSAARSLVADG